MSRGSRFTCILTNRGRSSKDISGSNSQKVPRTRHHRGLYEYMYIYSYNCALWCPDRDPCAAVERRLVGQTRPFEDAGGNADVREHQFAADGGEAEFRQR